MTQSTYRLGTLALHAGQEPDPATTARAQVIGHEHVVACHIHSDRLDVTPPVIREPVRNGGGPGVLAAGRPMVVAPDLARHRIPRLHRVGLGVGRQVHRVSGSDVADEADVRDVVGDLGRRPRADRIERPALAGARVEGKAVKRAALLSDPHRAGVVEEERPHDVNVAGRDGLELLRLEVPVTIAVGPHPSPVGMRVVRRPLARLRTVAGKHRHRHGNLAVKAVDREVAIPLTTQEPAAVRGADDAHPLLADVKARIVRILEAVDRPRPMSPAHVGPALGRRPGPIHFVARILREDAGLFAGIHVRLTQLRHDLLPAVLLHSRARPRPESGWKLGFGATCIRSPIRPAFLADLT